MTVIDWNTAVHLGAGVSLFPWGISSDSEQAFVLNPPVGMQFTLPESKLEFSLPDSKLDFTLPK